MISQNLLTAEEYAEQKFDLPEGGRWTELVAGRVITLQSPDDDYGNIVRALTMALSAFTHARGTGYACFELGLITKRGPDTVRCPPLCYITQGEPFGEVDSVVSHVKPALVVEIASSNDRRKHMDARVLEYQASGCKLIWVIDPVAKEVHVFEWGRDPRNYRSGQTLLGTAGVQGFDMPVADLFAEPKWWSAKAAN